jgi:hypothetical protein
LIDGKSVGSKRFPCLPHVATNPCEDEPESGLVTRLSGHFAASHKIAERLFEFTGGIDGAAGEALAIVPRAKQEDL